MTDNSMLVHSNKLKILRSKEYTGEIKAIVEFWLLCFYKNFKKMPNLLTFEINEIVIFPLSLNWESHDDFKYIYTRMCSSNSFDANEHVKFYI